MLSTQRSSKIIKETEHHPNVIHKDFGVMPEQHPAALITKQTEVKLDKIAEDIKKEKHNLNLKDSKMDFGHGKYTQMLVEDKSKSLRITSQASSGIGSTFSSKLDSSTGSKVGSTIKSSFGTANKSSFGSSIGSNYGSSIISGSSFYSKCDSTISSVSSNKSNIPASTIQSTVSKNPDMANSYIDNYRSKSASAKET